MKMMAFIPARGGSKGIVGKNIAKLGGKPLIQYTIEAAQKSPNIDKIFVSTDAPEIQKIVRDLGVAIEYLRPPALASDNNIIIDAVFDALEWLTVNNMETPENIVLLQPTSPLRTDSDIDGAVRQFLTSGTNSLVSVHSMSEHPYECVETVADGRWRYLAEPSKQANCRQQYQNGFYFINGAIYIAETAFLKEHRSFIHNSTKLYIMDRLHGIDIDNEDDLRYAEFIMQSKTIISS